MTRRRKGFHWGLQFKILVVFGGLNFFPRILLGNEQIELHVNVGIQGKK